MKSRKLMISVILPVKNGNMKLLKRAVSSILEQTYKKYEILLIDDGSHESFSKKLDILARNDSRIRLFHIKSSGVSYARNFAVTKARGDIITYLDGDDIISPVCFEEAVSFFNDPEKGGSVDAVWGGTFYGNKDNIKKRIRSESGVPKTVERLKEVAVKLTPGRIHKTRAECIGTPFRFKNEGYINRGIAARFIRKKAFNDGLADFPLNIRMYEDTIWNLKMMDSGMNIYYVKSIWYYYYENERSSSNRYNEHILRDLEEPLKIIDGILDLNDPEEYGAYTKFLMDSLRYVYKCKYGNPLWKPSFYTRIKFLKHIYNDRPWSEIADKRYLKAADRSDKIKAILYRAGLLFLYWKLTWKTV